ncbi:hypothetical protein RclHR1_03240013 [Rhizophagus clarus]|uniref:Uncharacterized protein n=1 Tax=Rhizophagus clarus TaxID=94130 RepID=A0A2Z6S381_9GLOM|nr:hypothetical protein RclHR1_03240013 [Rhizophagus clarus]GES74868.1 hypothetical protein GLOIN_2v1789243 [Rhizophagus clarus]
MILDDSIDDVEVKVLSTSRRPIPITPPVIPLSRSSARKKLKKLQQQQQQQLNTNPFITPSGPSPANTPSGSRVVTFSNSELSPPKISLKSSKDTIKPSEDSYNDKGKKKKQDHLTDNFGNSNLVLTSYCLQQEEQTQLLDVIVYDIPAKWDSYTLLGNLSFWEKIVLISTRVHKKYLSTRVRLIPNHTYLKAYNGGE